MAAVGNWFQIGVGTAIGIASAGQALGQGGVPFVSSLLIGTYGISGAFGATGALMLAGLVPRWPVFCETRLSAAPRCSKATPPRKKTDFPPQPLSCA